MTKGPDPTIEFGGKPPVEPAPTVAIPPAAEGPSRSSVLGLTFLAVAAGAFLIGIAAAALVRDEPAGLVAASQRAGPAGATIRFQGGEVRIPSGALANTTRIVVRRTVVAERVRVRPPGGTFQIYNPGELVAYVFEPAELDFLRPVTLIFRLSERDGDAATFARVGDATLLLGGKVDRARGTVAVEVSDFRFNRGQPIEADR